MPDGDDCPACFEPFRAAGWTVQGERQSDQGVESVYVVMPPTSPADDALPAVDPSLVRRQRALGLIDADPDPQLWALRASFRGDCTSSAPHEADVARALLDVMGAISACRLAALALRHGRWALAAFQGLEASVLTLRTLTKAPGGWSSALEPTRLADIKTMLGAVSSQCLACIDMLTDHQHPHACALDAESVVYVVANVDAAYYALLDHHLTSAWRTPAVPPPHVYFPTMVDELGAVAASAVTRLLTEKAAPRGADELRAVWGVREDWTLPNDANPLLQVMWAKWVEGALLLYASGLGDNGEMDAVADDEAHFMTWAASRAVERGNDGPIGAAAISPGLDVLDEDAAGEAAELPDGGASEDGSEEPFCGAERGDAVCANGEGSGGLQPRHAPSTAGIPVANGGARGVQLQEDAAEAAAAATGGDAHLGVGERLPHAGAAGDADEAGTGREGRGGGLGAALGLGDDELDAIGDKFDDGGYEEDDVRPPPPAHPALQAFRDSARAWPCHLYSFAAPNPEALAVLQELAPIVEVGAGVGYWAWLLRRRGVDVAASDSVPTLSASRDAPNRYHGRIPPWTPIEQADAASAASCGDRTLFLCYPPPADGMALAALQAYRGATVAVVGEWDGDTADAAFAAELQSGWTLARAVRLPNWSDTAHDLTVWTRRRGGDAPALGAWPICCATGASQAETLAAHGRGLKRCKYCRSLVFRDASALAAHGGATEQMLALHFVFFKRELDFDSDVDFETVALGVP